jgi:hypothetical protein
MNPKLKAALDELLHWFLSHWPRESRPAGVDRAAITCHLPRSQKRQARRLEPHRLACVQYLAIALLVKTKSRPVESGFSFLAVLRVDRGDPNSDPMLHNHAAMDIRCSATVLVPVATSTIAPEIASRHRPSSFSISAVLLNRVVPATDSGPSKNTNIDRLAMTVRSPAVMRILSPFFI